ncbi:MAG: PAS-domain containing protein [Hyphomicrobiaceae bacterium]
MIEGWKVALLALSYVGALFALAWIGDRTLRSRKGISGRPPLIYALSLAVYCTSWTFFGSVGLAAETGYDFIPVYLGPILMFVIGGPLLLRIVRLAKSQNITSVADFLAARYGKSPAVAAVVTGVAVVGTLPYIALQLKAISISVETLLGPGLLQGFVANALSGIDAAFLIALALAAFAILFGTRHIDATEHQDGLMLAIAAESLVKLATFLALGLFAWWSLFGGFAGFTDKVRANTEIQDIFGRGFNGGQWLTVTFLSLVCIVLLPRQFHVTVVENNSENELRRASWLFPIYLILINIFVVPIAIAGLVFLPPHSSSPDMYVLALPIWAGSDVMTVLAFIGGLSAATAMVIVDSVALAIMVCNGFVMPWILRRRGDAFGVDENMASLLLLTRRIAIFVILLLGYFVYRSLAQVHGLAAIGLVSFAAIAQLAPAFFGGLIWRKATARGAIAGIVVGFATWFYTLLLPWVITAGWIPMSLLLDGPLGIGFLKPQALFFLQFEPLTHGVLWSLIANVLCYVFVSLLRPPEPIERLQANIFVFDDLPRPVQAPSFRIWRTSVTVGDLQQAVGRYLGPERAERAFQEDAASRSVPLSLNAEADVRLLRFAEHLLTSAIGAASSRLVLSLLLRRADVSRQSALKLLDDASEAIQYNRDLLQSALDQVRHGLSVFDQDMRLVCWNRQFRELLDVPPELGRVGVPLDRILRACAERGDFGKDPVDKLVADRLKKLAVTKETYQEVVDPIGRILEVRTSAMPQGGIVTTYSDITDREAGAKALARANETLERRVAERTAELMLVNAALADAKAKAEEANLDKTRFLAAAGHDILQPLNAARLYASSLVERGQEYADAKLARNIDASLEAVEEIIGALLDISRLDAGRFEPDVSNIALSSLFDQLRVEFEPMAREQGLRLQIVATSIWVRTDRRLLRRVLQNLIANAIKYTGQGGVIVGVRRRRGEVVVQVSDTGPGIPQGKQSLIFKEFHRLDETATSVRGLGLGLSIVERIGKVLEAPIGLVSTPDRGSTFTVTLPAAAPQAVVSRPEQYAVPRGGDISGSFVLCIENERQVLDGMGVLLQGWGCRVLLANGKAQALALLRHEPDAPHVILADYHLDDGTGVEAVAAIRTEIHAEVPAVIISADTSIEVQRDIRHRGLLHLRKPLKAGALRSILMQLVLRRTAAE